MFINERTWETKLNHEKIKIIVAVEDISCFVCSFVVQQVVRHTNFKVDVNPIFICFQRSQFYIDSLGNSERRHSLSRFCEFYLFNTFVAALLLLHTIYAAYQSCSLRRGRGIADKFKGTIGTSSSSSLPHLIEVLFFRLRILFKRYFTKQFSKYYSSLDVGRVIQQYACVGIG